LREEEEDATGEPLTLLAELQLNTDKEQEAIEALKTLCAGVEATEPGMLAYMCTRSKEEPERIIFFEIYKDAAAMKAHEKTPHHDEFFQNVVPRMFKLLNVPLLGQVGGFTRRYSVS
jgi:quinol monooxygenase YgiN